VRAERKNKKAERKYREGLRGSKIAEKAGTRMNKNELKLKNKGPAK
jgi:hypothetical protein